MSQLEWLFVGEIEIDHFAEVLPKARSNDAVPLCGESDTEMADAAGETVNVPAPDGEAAAVTAALPLVEMPDSVVPENV